MENIKSINELEQVFYNPTPSVEDDFGETLALSDDQVLIGARGDDTGATDSGAAYLFDSETGELLQSFYSPTPRESDNFGDAVSLTDNQALIGSPALSETSDAGTAYLFNTKSGELVQSFVNPNSTGDDDFGEAVALKDEQALVGARGDDTGATDSGAAYLFDTQTGELLQSFVSPTPNEDAGFGETVALVDDRVVIGAPEGVQGDAESTALGAVYLYDANTGELLQSFTNPTASEGSEFGEGIALSGNQILIGAPGDDTGATDSGAAYLFDTQTGELLQTFFNPEPVEGADFGESVALTDDYVVIGAANNDTGATDSGVAYVFDIQTGDLLQTIVNPDPEADDLFGDSLVVNEDNEVLIGAFSDGTTSPNSGAAYLFELSSSSVSSSGNRIYGGDGNDTLIGGSNDLLVGDDGDDQLFAGKGGNTLVGGEGKDQFWVAYGSLPAASNTITDFTIGTDVIGFSGLSNITEFADLNLVQSGADTQIFVDGQTEAIATLRNNQAETLTSSSFVFV
ncbi:hypothetical protein IFO70_37500 [Phormidium tenue FACHB-886]|nr:hypothetical protein [Phormidium tenue FACHB-886]